MTRLYRLSVLATSGIFALIALGGAPAVWHRGLAVAIGSLLIVVAVETGRVAGVRRRTVVAAWTSVGMLAAQALLGALAAWRDLPIGFAVAHLGAAVLCLGGALLTAYYVALDRGTPSWIARAGLANDDGVRHDLTFLRIAQFGALATLLLILTGGATSSSGAALSCDSWPGCLDARFVPAEPADGVWVNLSHRAVAVVGGMILAGVAIAARRRRAAPEAQRLAIAACAVLALQVLVGALFVWTEGGRWIGATHLTGAALVWGLMLGVAIVAGRAWESVVVLPRIAANEPETPPLSAQPQALRSAAAVGGAAFARMTASSSAPPIDVDPSGGAALAAPYGPTPFVLIWPDLRAVRQTIADYVALTKPGIMTLLLLTTLGAMLVAAEGFPALWLILVTLLGGTLAAGGANALNCYLDRDIDAQMPRTRKRGTANGRISPNAALTFGITLSVLAVIELGVLVNWLAALLALAGNVFYVFIYTKWLKRTTPQNIVIGGAAGAVPPLVGWAAVTGDVSWAPWLMFLTIFMWTPPHFWALALLKQGEYGRAAVPMLPVVAGEAATRRQIVVYTILLIPVTLALGLVGLGWLYLAIALILNSVFLWLAVRLWQTHSKRLARRTFFWSLWYLAFLFVAMVVDRLALG